MSQNINLKYLDILRFEYLTSRYPTLYIITIIICTRGGSSSSGSSSSSSSFNILALVGEVYIIYK
jgi:hypothetical protein